MKTTIRLEVKGRAVALGLLGDGKTLEAAHWEDRRDLPDRFFRQLERMLLRRKLSRRDIEGFDFSCDSPYFARNGAIRMEELDSTGRCGFTAWQAGETLARVFNFAQELS